MEDVPGVGKTKLARALADDITKGSLSDYEKCKQIEMFLRQYAYSEDSVGGSLGKRSLTGVFFQTMSASLPPICKKT